MTHTLCAVYIHTPDFSEDDVVINVSKFPAATVGSLVSIQPRDSFVDVSHGANRRPLESTTSTSSQRSTTQNDNIYRQRNENIILQVKSLTSLLTGQAFISVKKSIALQMGIRARQTVKVSFVEPEHAAISFVDISLCSTGMTQAEIWILRQNLLNQCLHVGRKLSVLGFEAEVTAVVRDDEAA